MPAYPPGPPTLSGDLETIDKNLQNPLYIKRRLRTFSDLRFISDQLLQGRYRSVGGAVMYEVSEAIIGDRPATGVAPGAEYEYTNLVTSAAAIAAVVKWGKKAFLSDELILRNIYGGDEVDRQLRKLVNTIISQVDAVSLSAIGSAITQTQAATATWATLATATPLYDIYRAIGIINALNLGYKADTVFMRDAKFAALLANPIVAAAIQRENPNTPVYTGELPVISGLKILVTNQTPTDDVWVVDSTQLGGMADEQDSAPGYTVTDMAIQVLSNRITERDGWELQGRRKTVPLVQEPGAGVKITGT